MDAQDSAGPPEPPLLIVHAGDGRKLNRRYAIELEDGTLLGARKSLPRDLPLGYHKLRDTESEKQIRLIVTPEQCYLRERFRTWGWTIQLYATRSQSSWGIGDLADLRRIAAWSADVLSAGIVMTNPIGATAPAKPQQPSPYFPSSRLFRNPLYLRIEEVPEARNALHNLECFAARGRALNEGARIDRDAIYELKLQALEQIWAHVRERVNLPPYNEPENGNLDLFATFCALTERHGACWHEWPDEYQRPRAPGVPKFSAEFQDRIRFYKWLQHLIDSQLERASARGMILADLPIGVDSEGFDSWLWQDTFAKQVTVGAPPDPFSAKGQNWGLPPFIPHKLRAAAYEPFIQTLRSAMRFSAGLRIDHVMGLFRLFWIPMGASPVDGAYVRYNSQELLSILALESARAKAFVVGEDLGTVEPGVREKLAEFRVLSYRVLWFEEKHPKHYPELSLAAAGTHDLPTIAGVWSRADLREQEHAGLEPNERGLEGSRKQLARIANVSETAPVSEAILKAHEALAEAPSAIIVASLEDALGAEQRPNLPGAANDKRPNWSIPLPKKLEEIETDPSVLKLAHVLQESLLNRTLSAEPD